MRWPGTLSFEKRTSQIVYQECVQAVRDMEARLERLEAEIHASAMDGPHSSVIQALQALKGVAEITAVTVVAELGEFSRFDHLEALMGYSVLVPRGHSSGSGWNHEDGQQSHSVRCRRSGLGIPTQTGY